MTTTPNNSIHSNGASSNGHDPSVAQLMRDLSREVSTLVHQEVQLAKVELTEKGKRAGIGIGMFGGAGVIGVFAFGALIAAGIAALSLVFATWLAALIVAAALGAVAGILAMMGRSQVKRGIPPVPQQTVETVRDDAQVVKQRIQSGRHQHV